jgi:glycosidase
MVILLCGTLPAAVQKVEPPSWWPGHSVNPVRILLTGTKLSGTRIVTGSTSLRAGPVRTTEDSRYAFFDLTITPGARPGSYTLSLGSDRFNFELRTPLPRSGRFQGFGPGDVIYLIMPDRFANGDSSNDVPSVDRADRRMYHGGDLRGIIKRLSYLEDLGVTALWLTPLYENSDGLQQSRSGPYSSYHGYGAVDFYAIEQRFGTFEILRELVDAAHTRGIKIILDQIANHTGEDHPWAAAPPTGTWLHARNGGPLELWSITDPHASPEIRRRTLEGWFANRLPDLNQNDEEVARYLIQNTLWWIGMTGIDGIRQDTVPYVPRPFWQKWNAAIKREYPGLTVVGEVFSEDAAVVTAFRDAGFDSLFDFPLYFALRRVFIDSAQPRELARSVARDWLLPNSERLVTFLGLHDVPRFRHKGTAQGLRDAFTFLLTTRGIPLIYYGDEIGMTGAEDPDNRRDFPGGWSDDPRNAFEASGRTADENAIHGHLRKLLHLRRTSAALRGGALLNLHADASSYVYARRAGRETIIVSIGAASEIEVSGFEPGVFRDGTQTAALAEGRLSTTGTGVFIVR